MAQQFPYTYYSCDCYDSKITSLPAKHSSQPPPDDDEDERTFDPRNPRSNYSLYPLEHLLYCEDCQQIRCPRCVTEETQNWYCPSCLFEVPSSVIKSDGHRCTRNCYNCPICTSPMTVSSLENPAEPSATGGPYILACHYCHWSTVEIGIEFEKHTGITAQLSRIANGGGPIPTQREREKERERRKESDSRKNRDILSESDDSPIPSQDRDAGPPSHDDTFQNLSAFYKSQLAAQNSSSMYSAHDMSFASPSTYSRLLLSYSSTSRKQKRDKPSQMREASSLHEGLRVHDPSSDAAVIDRIKREGWSGTLSPTQKAFQNNPNARFTSDVRPMAAILCTKRGKRCRTCRQYLSKPDSKVTSTRYKIKLLALNHIPRLSLRALPPQPSTPGGPSPATAQPFNYNALRSGIPTHFILHLSNPLFDPIRVTLAAPATTSGKVQSRVTILCPQFEVGANTDVWDDALASPGPLGSGGSGGKSGDGQIEAGKIWERGRNWTSVVIEVVPGFIEADKGKADDENEVKDDNQGEDENVLEIPVFVRLEFEADISVHERELGDSRGKAGEREKREEAFWAVVGVGRILG